MEQLETANAALSSRNKVLEILHSPEMQQDIEGLVKQKLKRQKELGKITVIKNDV